MPSWAWACSSSQGFVATEEPVWGGCSAGDSSLCVRLTRAMPPPTGGNRHEVEGDGQPGRGLRVLHRARNGHGCALPNCAVRLEGTNQLRALAREECDERRARKLVALENSDGTIDAFARVHDLAGSPGECTGSIKAEVSERGDCGHVGPTPNPLTYRE